MAESKEELKSLLMRVDEEIEKAGLKLKIQKAKSPSLHGKEKRKKWKHWQISTDSKITADSDYSHETKRHLLLGKKAMTNLDSILKISDITLLIKVQ